MLIVINTDEGYVEVGGVKWSFAFFEAMGCDKRIGYPEGTYFKIVERDKNGMLSICRYDPSTKG